MGVLGRISKQKQGKQRQDMLQGLNHLTLAVSDLQTSINFYHSLLGMNVRAKWNKGAYLECGNLWLCLSLDENRSFANPETSDYTHYAFTIEEKDFANFLSRLEQEKIPLWETNASEGNSCYFLDPDGHKLEVHVGGLSQRIEHCRSKPYEGMTLL